MTSKSRPLSNSITASPTTFPSHHPGRQTVSRLSPPDQPSSMDQPSIRTAVVCCNAAGHHTPRTCIWQLSTLNPPPPPQTLAFIGARTLTSLTHQRPDPTTGGLPVRPRRVRRKQISAPCVILSKSKAQCRPISVVSGPPHRFPLNPPLGRIFDFDAAETWHNFGRL